MRRDVKSKKVISNENTTRTTTIREDKKREGEREKRVSE